MASASGSAETEKSSEDGNGLLLYQCYPSYFCQKVVFAMHEKKLKFKSHIVDLYQGEQFEPWFLKLNPKTEVPVLKDGVKIIPDSRRIIDYLEDNFSNGSTPRLIPEKGSPQFQSTERLRDLLDNLPIELISFGCLFHPELTGKVKMSPKEVKARQGRYTAHIALMDEYAEKHKELNDQYLAKKHNLQKRETSVQDVNEVKKALVDLEYVLGEVENELASHEGVKKKWWLCCEKFTIADITLSVLLHRMKTTGLTERYFKDDRYPNLHEYFKRVQQRDSYRRTMNQSSGILKSFCCMGTRDQMFVTVGSAAVILCAAGVAAFLIQRKK